MPDTTAPNLIRVSNPGRWCCRRQPGEWCYDCPKGPREHTTTPTTNTVCCGTTTRPWQPSAGNPNNCAGCPGRNTVTP